MCAMLYNLLLAHTVTIRSLPNFLTMPTDSSLQVPNLPGFRSNAHRRDPKAARFDFVDGTMREKPILVRRTARTAAVRNAVVCAT